MSFWRTPHPNPPPQGGRGFDCAVVSSPSPLEGEGGVGGDARGVSANGGSATARSLLLALGAALALSVAHASADEIDPQELGAIDATMTEFVHAVAKTSGARASELVDESWRTPSRIAA
jgi:hypothetical protein